MNDRARHILLQLLIGITFSCTGSNEYQRIVNKSWIQDSSHSLLTAYSFEFEDYLGKTLREFLAAYPDSAHSHHFIEEPACTLQGWLYWYSGNDFLIQVYFNYGEYSYVIKRDTMSLMHWDHDEYLDQRIRKFEVRDNVNSNFIVPRKFDKLNRKSD